MTAGGNGAFAPELAHRLLEQLEGQHPDLTAAALLGADGNQVAATDDADWASGAAALWAAADAEGSSPAFELHVATEAGEVFSVRGGSAAIVATAERFALASLMFCDLRAVLRALEADGEA